MTSDATAKESQKGEAWHCRNATLKFFKKIPQSHTKTMRE